MPWNFYRFIYTCDVHIRFCLDVQGNNEFISTPQYTTRLCCLDSFEGNIYFQFDNQELHCTWAPILKFQGGLDIAFYILYTLNDDIQRGMIEGY